MTKLLESLTLKKRSSNSGINSELNLFEYIAKLHT